MKKRIREPKPLLPALAAATGPGLIKYLASCNTTVRSQSLRLLQSWLASQSQELSDSDIRKLWKGLFYCLWHSDKTPNQVALIDRLTSVFLSLHNALSVEFFRGFLVTLRREWPGIDRLRLDKFYLLIRRFMKALFELMSIRKWNLDVLGEYIGVLERYGFLAEDKLRGNGVNYHVVSVFLEELKGVGFPVRKEVIDVILGPFFAVMMKGEDKILMGKVKSCVFDELLKVGEEILSKKRMGVDCDEKDMLLGVVALKMGLSGRFYEVGSSADCIQGNRKVVLGLHQEFLKLERDFESSGIEITPPEYTDASDGEMPQLIPIDFDSSVEKGAVDGNDNEINEDQPVTKVSKKDKKAKKEKNGNDKKKKKKKDHNKVSETDGDLIMTADSANVESAILNLRKQFEKVAAETGTSNDEDLDLELSVAPVKSNKRKRAKRANDQKLANTNGTSDDPGKSVDRSAKKVRFSMKNNIVWKPQNPLPPESLRLPPSVTPRGSALKKGVPPGPVVEMPLVKLKPKKKKMQNRLKVTMMKRRKNVQRRSM